MNNYKAVSLKKKCPQIDHVQFQEKKSYLPSFLIMNNDELAIRLKLYHLISRNNYSADKNVPNLIMTSSRMSPETAFFVNCTKCDFDLIFFSFHIKILYRP